MKAGATLLATLALSFMATGAASAAVHKAFLQIVDFPSPAYRTVTVRTVIDPGSEVAPHTHPGLEMAYVVEGEALLQRAGSSPRQLQRGDSVAIAARTVHSVKNIGRIPLTIVSTYVVDRNSPLASPATMVAGSRRRTMIHSGRV